MMETAVATRSASLSLLLALMAGTALAQTVEGTATYRQRMTVPNAAVFEAVLEDVSRADAPATEIAHTRLTSPANPPISFTITYDAGKILANHRYAVRARILVDGKALFTTDSATLVITPGRPNKVDLLLRRVSAGEGPPASPTGNQPLESTYWKATELGRKATPTEDPKREAHLQFQAGGRVSGSDGCNRLTGTVQRTGNRITFGQMAGTQMACLNPSGTERPFRDALKEATRFTITGDRLELFDRAGTRLAAFVANRQSSAPTPSASLAGTAWQLVKFQSSDDTVLTPDDRTKYTIEFASGGRLTARVDCNRGRGTWKSSGANQIVFGSLALTRAKCPPSSLHDQIVKQWGNIRSYVIQDGRLFLSLMADGGIYEFEPMSKAR